MKKRIVIIIMSVALMSTIYTLPVLAAGEVLVPKEISHIDRSDITLYADVIVKKYRVNNGVLQYRRWNESKKRWVDSRWINA